MEKEVTVGGVHVAIAQHTRYLGVELDERGIYHHFRLLVPKLERTAASLDRLLPNLRGSGNGPRKLYAGVLRSMVRYGAPK